MTKEKDKFELDKDFEAMAPELQQAAKALLPCLRNSEADKVEMLLNEEWQTYVKSSCDAVMLKACKLPDLQHQWETTILCAVLAEVCCPERPQPSTVSAARNLRNNTSPEISPRQSMHGDPCHPHHQRLAVQQKNSAQTTLNSTILKGRWE